MRWWSGSVRATAQLRNTLGEILSIPGDFSTSKETRTSKTSVGEIVIELRELCIGGRSSIFGSDDESWKTE